MLNKVEHIFSSPKVIGQAKMNTLAYHAITLIITQLYFIAQAPQYKASLSPMNSLWITVKMQNL